MESDTLEEEPRVKRSHYHKSLLLCVVLSIGICCTVLLNVPSGSSKEPSDSGDITYIITRCCITIALVFLEVFTWCLVRKRDNFHSKQDIFWPMRCQHCACAVGLLPQLGRKLGVRRKLKRSRSLDHLDQADRGSSDVSLAYIIQREQDRLPKVLPEVQHPLYHKPHKSLLNTFYIFGIVVVINIPLQCLAYIICIATTDQTPIVQIAIVSQALLDVNFTAAILFAMIFFENFYDAAFVDETKFALPLAVLFASCLWIAADRALKPLGEIMNPEFTPNEYPCKLPGKFGSFINRNDMTLTPFYAEYVIISAAMMWRMWSSIVPRCCLETTKSTKQFQGLGPRYFGPFRMKIIAYFHNIIGRRWSKFISIKSSREERRRLLPIFKKEKCWNVPKGVTTTVVAYIILGITYFSVCQVLEFSDLGLPHKYHEITLTYLRWFLQSVFYLPLLAMLRYRTVLSGSSTSFKPRRTVSLFTGLIGAHDLIILTSCVGIFTLNIFRFVSSAGVLLHAAQRPAEEVSLACFAGVFAIFQSYSAWVMTSFLLVVQRQEIRGLDEAKWTLICLIYTGILNATQWLIDSVGIHAWVELTMFYGPTQGMVFGAFLEPLTSLYGIHSAMIAYESFKTIRNDS